MRAARPDPDPTPRQVASPFPGGPTVQRIVLGTRLRRLREAAGISPRERG
jgi:hypothetical protein